MVKVVKVILVIFNFGRGYFAHYIYKYKYLLYSGVYLQPVSDFDHLDHDHLDQSKKIEKKLGKHSRTAMKDYYLCSVKLK